jgi:hypothetical protein
MMNWTDDYIYTDLKEYISKIMNQECQSADSVEVANPREGQQGQSEHMVSEHLPKVLPLDIEELWPHQWPIETRCHHIVPPDITGHALYRKK